MAKELINEIKTSEYVDLTKLSPLERKALRNSRWKARTDMRYLCTEVLGMDTLFIEETHGNLIDSLQKFALPRSPKDLETHDRWDGKWIYTPLLEDMTLLPGKRRRLIIDFRGVGKCERASALVNMADGTYKRADQIRVGDQVIGFTENFDIISTSVTGVEKQPAQKIYKIKTKSGREIEVSNNHPFRQVDKWTEAQDLKPGDRIFGLNIVPFGSLNLPYAEFVGWMLGDGTCNQQLVTNHDENLRLRIAESGLRAGGEATEYDKGVRFRGLRNLCRELGIFELKSHNKYIPEIFWKADKESVRDLMIGLFSSDGSLNKRGIELTSKSHQLVKDIKRLLLKFAINSVVRERKVLYKGQHLPFYVLHISDSRHVQKFLNNIGWYKKHTWTPTAFHNPNIDTVPKEWRALYPKYLFSRGEKPPSLRKRGGRGLATYNTRKDRLAELGKHLNDRRLLNLGSDDIVWDFVEEVTCIGEEETIGIETGNHTICVEDFGTHNTTFNSEAHTVQWIINYPDIGLAIFQYSLSKAEAILASIKHHFCFNGKFRALFPELCPPVEKIYDFGTKAEFTTPGRSLKRSRREPTVITASIESGLAGYHFEVIKFSDVVEPKNTENIDQCLKTIKQFELSKPLLNSPKYWIDVEGTRYHFADLYGKILEQWEQERNAGEETEWNIYLRGCLKRDVPGGKYTFTPDDYKYPHLKDQDGNRISWFPKNYPLKALETIEKYEPEVFASQYENHPIGGRGGIPDFPIIEKDGKYERPAIISLSDYDRVLKARKILSVDLAETVGEKSNYTVFVFATLDRHGRTYVEGIVREKYTPDQSTDALIAACNIFKPDELLIEEVNFTRGFMVGLRRQWDLNKHYFRPTIRMYKRDNIKTKEERIRLSLQYSYKNGDLRFVRDKISKKSWDALIGELYEFPKGKTDDILDALTDLFSERSWFGQEWAKAKPIPELSFKGPSEAVQRAAFMAAAGIDEPRWDEGTTNYINILTPDSIHSVYRKLR